jgi:hypothetical protein
VQHHAAWQGRCQPLAAANLTANFRCLLALYEAWGAMLLLLASCQLSLHLSCKLPKLLSARLLLLLRRFLLLPALLLPLSPLLLLPLLLWDTLLMAGRSSTSSYCCCLCRSRRRVSYSSCRCSACLHCCLLLTIKLL